MSTAPDTPSESIVDMIVDSFASSFTVGTDADGYDHHYYRPADAVVVYDEGGVSHYKYLDGRKLDDWIAFVRERRGWECKGPHAPLGVQEDRRRKDS